MEISLGMDREFREHDQIRKGRGLGCLCIESFLRRFEFVEHQPGQSGHMISVFGAEGRAIESYSSGYKIAFLGALEILR